MVGTQIKQKNKKLSTGMFIWVFKFLAILPHFITRGLALLIGYLSYVLPNKTQKIIRANLKICYPAWTNQAIEALVKKNCLENAKLAMEFPTAWLGQKNKIENLLIEINNQSLVNDLVKKQQPLIIAVPHIGNWEFFWHWMQLNFPTIGMYSPASHPQLDQLMLTSRLRFGGQPFATDAKGIMSLLRALKKGSVMMILPDQVPRKESGIYSPFYGQSAYTMTLLHRFVQKTGAHLLFGSCLRSESSNGFIIDIQQPEFDIRVDSVEEFNRGMNKQLETTIRKNPAQYQWAYKRFKHQRDGTNFYKK